MANELDFNGKKYIGTLGSGDLFSKEIDRITYLHCLFGELSEDMESIAVLKACEQFGIDRIALRIISNNEITLQEFDEKVCPVIQNFIIKFIDKIIETKG